MKLCVGCAHFRRQPGFWPQVCQRPVPDGETSSVDGSVERYYLNARAERAKARKWFGRERCGPDALFFLGAAPRNPPQGGTAVKVAKPSNS